MCGGLFIGSRKSESLDSAFTLEGAALCFITFSGIISIYTNGSGSTFTLVIVGAAAGFTVNLDGLAATAIFGTVHSTDRKSTRLNSSHVSESRMPSSA